IEAPHRKGGGDHPTRRSRQNGSGVRDDTQDADNKRQNPFRLHVSSSRDEIASTTRNGSRPARCATSAAARPEGASKTKKQISSLGTWIECSKRTRAFCCVSSSAAERARRSRAARSPAC